MPSVAPRALHCHRGGAWVPAARVWLRDGGVWVEPRFVWVFSGGEWLLVHAAAPAAPVDVDAEFGPTGAEGTVVVSWTAAPVEAADRYRVYRPDGSLVAEVSVGEPGSLAEASYEVVDVLARPVVAGRYSVAAVLGGVVGEPVDAASALTIGAAPATFTATVNNVSGSPVSVSLAWAPVADSVGYVITRPDGSQFVAGMNVSSAVDSAPRPGVGKYEVQTLTGSGVAGPGRLSASTLRFAQVATSVAATTPGSASANVVVSWSLATSGFHDYVRVIRRRSSGATSSVDLARSATSWTDTASPDGEIATYSVVTGLSGGAGDESAAVVVNVPPQVPVSVALSPTSTVGVLALTWGHPGGRRTGYDVEWSETLIGPFQDVLAADGLTPITEWPPNTTRVENDFGNVPGTEGYMRVRTRGDSGGIAPSAWVTLGPVEPLIDVTPPSEPTLVSFRPRASYGRMVAEFRLPSNMSDNGQYQVQRKVNDEDVETLIGWGYGPSSFDFTANVGSHDPGDVVRVRCKVRDRWGNARTGVWHTYTLEASPTEVDATTSTSWIDGEYNEDGTRRVYQGSLFGQNATGYLFYGTRIASAVDGKTVTAIRVLMHRDDGLSGGKAAFVGLHALTSSPSTGAGSRTAVTNVVNLGNLPASGSEWLTFTDEQRAALVAGTAKGVALYSSSGVPFLWLESVADNDAQGRIRVYHLG